jgi:hypothetical protein
VDYHRDDADHEQKVNQSTGYVERQQGNGPKAKEEECQDQE